VKFIELLSPPLQYAVVEKKEKIPVCGKQIRHDTTAAYFFHEYQMNHMERMTKLRLRCAKHSRSYTHCRIHRFM